MTPPHSWWDVRLVKEMPISLQMTKWGIAREMAPTAARWLAVLGSPVLLWRRSGQLEGQGDPRSFTCRGKAYLEPFGYLQFYRAFYLGHLFLSLWPSLSVEYCLWYSDVKVPWKGYDALLRIFLNVIFPNRVLKQWSCRLVSQGYKDRRSRCSSCTWKQERRRSFPLACIADSSVMVSPLPPSSLLFSLPILFSWHALLGIAGKPKAHYLGHRPGFIQSASSLRSGSYAVPSLHS